MGGFPQLGLSAGLKGATAAARFVGATTTGSPVTGTFAVGDFIIDQTGSMWVCTVAGTPGTWVNATGGGGAPSGPAGGDLTGTYPNPTFDLTKTHVWLAEQTAPDWKTTGLTGSVAASRYVGATASGAPVAGAHLVGDFVIDQTGAVFVCTVAGTPGTWVQAGGPPTGAAGGDLTGTYPNPTFDLTKTHVWLAEQTAPDWKAAGLTGAVAASRYAGATASGSPVAGTFAVGDFVIDQTGKVWVCTVAGTPGTWVNVGAGGSPTDVQVFTVSGTWTKPAGAVVVDVVAFAGGGGGGSGRKGAAGSIRCGGGGGGAGGCSFATLKASDLGATEAVSIGAGGTAGAAQATNSTNGNAGGNGGISFVGAVSATAHVNARAGNGGAGGTATTGTGGAAGSGTIAGIGGTAASTTGLLGAVGGDGGATASGGSGAGISAADAVSAGGDGGRPGTRASATRPTGGAATGATGGAGTVIDANSAVGGTGGAGGGSQLGAGGAGGAGIIGSGGGGGAAGLDAVGDSGAGGVGGAGFVVVVSYV